MNIWNNFFRVIFVLSLITFFNACTTITTIQPESQVIAVRSNNLLYIRTAWNDSKDLVQRITLHTQRKHSNDVVNFAGVKLIPNNTIAAGTESAYNFSKDILAYQGDDAAPLNYNGTYIGGNHGANVIQQITDASHGKTTADIGSEWTDDKGTKWYVMRIVDANTLWLLSQNIGAAQWKFATAISGSSLTHSAKAVNAGAINFTSSTTTQLCPATALHTKKTLLNGTIEICKDGVYRGDSITIEEMYSIPNVESVLNHVKSKAGLWTQPPRLNDDILNMDIMLNINYQFHGNGSCTILHTIRACQNIALCYIGGIQARALNYDGKSIEQYIPKTIPVKGKTKTWNFAKKEDITSNVDDITFPSATWSSSSYPPDRMVQVVKNGTIKEYGFMLGYSQIQGNRANDINNAGFIFTTKKQYPFAFNKAISVNNSVSIVAYRCFFNYDKVPEATVFTWYYDGPDIVIIMDFHQSVTLLNLPLPAEFADRKIQLIESGGSFSLLSNEFVSDGLLVTVNQYGYGIIKLTQ